METLHLPSNVDEGFCVHTQELSGPLSVIGGGTEDVTLDGLLDGGPEGAELCSVNPPLGQK